MFIKIYKDDIIEGLAKSANIIPAKTGAAFLRSIWLKASQDGLVIMSTDSNLEFSGSYSGETMEDGLVGVQGRSFYDLVRRLAPGEIILKVDADGKNLAIEQGKDVYRLPVNDASWFKEISPFPEEGSMFWSGDMLEELIDKVSFCISDEDAMEGIACLSLKRAPRTAPNGSETKVVEACGLNGHQFAMLSLLHDDLYDMVPENGILIQKKYLMELKKWLPAEEVELSLGEKRLFFRSAEKTETFSLPLSFYQYPDYHNFLAKLGEDSVSLLTVGRQELAGYLDRLSIFNTENNRCTYFSFSPTELKLNTQGQDVGSADVSLGVDFNGSIPKIAFPTKNLIEILSHYASKKLAFTLTGTEGPCGIRGEEDPEYVVIIMPMKIVEETYYSEENA